MLENYFRRKYGILHLFGFTQEDRHLFALSLKYTSFIIRSFTLRLFFKIDLFIYSVKMGSYHAALAGLALILRNAGFNMV